MEEKIDLENLPKHIAIIMDGNRRWAKNNNLDSANGHKAGAENLKRIAKYANEIGIKYMTVYAFSTENWKRSNIEINAIMKLLHMYLDDFYKNSDTKIKINVIGNLNSLPGNLHEEINKAVAKTNNNTGMILNIAFNYGGRDEIVRATRNIAKLVVENNISIEEINEKLISDNLYTRNQPDPDLLIRTSGEKRTSNFLPWQLVYSEFIFEKKYWPEFSNEDFINAIKTYQNRTRKFGGQ